MENNSNEQKFWTVQLLPLRQEDKEKISMCVELQEEVCIKRKIFGMGWTDDNGNFLRQLFSEFTLYTENYENDNRNKISKEKAEEIIENANKSIEDINNEIKKFNESKKNNKDMKNELNKINIKVENNMDVLDFYNKIYDAMFGGSFGLSNTIKHYKNIKKDDLVIARLKSGKYCIGRVKNNKIICMGKNNEYSKNAEIQDNILKKNNASSTGFSWCMSVYKWYIIEEYDIPGHISGRFSGRSARRTICPVRDNDGGHMQQLMKIIYYKCEQEDKEFDKNKRLKVKKPEPIPLKIDNIAEALSPYELEDLVFLYIMNKHENEGFKLLPSKCKIDEVRYECYIINENDTEKVIAFQVKNKAKIECSIYVDNDNNIKKIYLYSGKGYTWENEDLSENNKEIEEKIREKSKTNNIEIISNEELFDIFIKSKFFKYQIEKGYYTLEKG